MIGWLPGMSADAAGREIGYNQFTTLGLVLLMMAGTGRPVWSISWRLHKRRCRESWSKEIRRTVQNSRR